ncbi:MAG: DUF2279 domain-containing protein [FCB group bacterium]
MSSKIANLSMTLLLLLFYYNMVFSQDSTQKNLNNTQLNQATTKDTLPATVPISQFLFAGNKRYTIDGTLPYLHTNVKALPTTIFTCVLTGIFIVQHEMQQNTIWKRVGPFQVAEDAKYSAYLDKCGHFYGTFMPSYVFSECLIGSGFGWDDASLIGGVLGLAYNTYVEIHDGFSKDFGFSPSDWYGDVAGATFFIAQHYIPFLQNFTPKFMYVQPSWHHEVPRLDALSFIDNYSTQTFYMGINVYNMLPDDLKKYWVPWLELSFGYAVYSMSEGTTSNGAELIYDEPNTKWGKVYGNRKFLISLDYNLINLLPDGGWFWNWFRQGLNYFKLPSPTIEIGKVTKFYLLYPFSINIGKTRF